MCLMIDTQPTANSRSTDGLGVRPGFYKKALLVYVVKLKFCPW